MKWIKSVNTDNTRSRINLEKIITVSYDYTNRFIILRYGPKSNYKMWKYSNTQDFKKDVSMIEKVLFNSSENN